MFYLNLGSPPYSEQLWGTSVSQRKAPEIHPQLLWIFPSHKITSSWVLSANTSTILPVPSQLFGITTSHSSLANVWRWNFTPLGLTQYIKQGWRCSEDGTYYRNICSLLRNVPADGHSEVLGIPSKNVLLFVAVCNNCNLELIWSIYGRFSKYMIIMIIKSPFIQCVLMLNHFLAPVELL